MDQLTDYFSLNGKVALVTGATHGIGLQIACALSAAGARLAILDVREQEGTAIAGLLDSWYNKARFWQLDVSNDIAVKRVIAAVEAHFGRIDILVNSAGVDTEVSPGRELSTTQWERAMQLNVNGSILCSKHIVGAMERAGGGAIVNVLSPFRMTGRRNTTADLASKAVLRLACVDAQRYAARNIRVNSIHPGLTRPPTVSTPPRDDYHLTQTFTNKAQIRLPRRSDLSTDVAAGILYLVSDAGRFVTGSEMVINAGFTH